MTSQDTAQIQNDETAPNQVASEATPTLTQTPIPTPIQTPIQTKTPEISSNAADTPDSNQNSKRPARKTRLRNIENKQEIKTKIISTKPKTKTKKKRSKEDASLDCIWICTECREAECVTHPDSPLLVCEGPCRRPFHYPCAGLPCVPPSDEQWICNDCLNSRHECTVCHEYGVDNVDVFKCDKNNCGLFYHEACLNMYDISVDLVEVVNNRVHVENNDSNSGDIVATNTTTAVDVDNNDASKSNTALVSVGAEKAKYQEAERRNNDDTENIDKEITASDHMRLISVSPVENNDSNSGANVAVNTVDDDNTALISIGNDNVQEQEAKSKINDDTGNNGKETSSSELVRVVSVLPQPEKVTFRPKFICPAHSCWTCSGGPPPDETLSTTSKTLESTPVPTINSATNSTATAKKGKKGKKAKKTVDNAFCEKKEKRLFRCLNCPIAYHISCIPPSCKFHELALLCHEHASTSKLPYLDVENSCQKGIEDRADRMIQAARSVSKKRGKSGEDDDLSSSSLKKRKRLMMSKKNCDEQNYFLPGKTFMNGDWTTPYQKQIVELLMTSNEFQDSSSTFSGGRMTKKSLSSFCLPCDIQHEVYSKPPVYAHIHSNRYNTNRPKRYPPSTESCDCFMKQGICDEHCMNRISGIECVGYIKNRSGEKSSYWNCKCDSDCGNRLLSNRRLAKCRPKRQQGKGWGLITVDGVKKGHLVQEYVGEIIDEKMKRHRLEMWSKDHPNDPNFYIMQLEPGWYIDAREKGSLSRFINHSCNPNCHLFPVNVSGHMRVAVVANRNIAPGEFLDYDYHFDTQDGDKFICRCGANNCRGTMKGGQLIEEDNEKKLTKSERWVAAKSKLDRDKKFIEDISRDEKIRLNQTCATLPGEKSNISNIVANGPDMSNAIKGRQYRVCLRRNVIAGSNFSSRYWRLQAAKEQKYAKK